MKRQWVENHPPSRKRNATGAGTPPSQPGRSSTPLLAAGIVLVLAIVGLVAYTRSSTPEPAADARRRPRPRSSIRP